jgi:predicted nucleotidyltransferase component of viral defense system
MQYIAAGVEFLYTCWVPLSGRQVVEMFHLVFLRALVAKGEEKGLIALKGGCNLRFYFGSVRYSEDIDLDVVVIAKHTLENKVERLLRSPIVSAPLKTRGIEITDTSAPKQTETTQRWKVGLRLEASDVPLRTKIEFSRRDAIVGATFEATSREVLRAYALTPMLATHYGAAAAIAQKVHALAGRAEPQARDVFDLNLLFARPEAMEVALDGAMKGRLPAAIEHAMSISFDDYVSKVVAFLDPDQAELLMDRGAWDAMQDEVVTRLEALR